MTPLLFLEMCFLSNNIHDYHYVSQGKVTVASIDDREDMEFTDVSGIVELFSSAQQFHWSKTHYI